MIDKATILNEALEAVTNSRAKMHGDAYEQHVTFAKLAEALFEDTPVQDLTAEDMAVLMILVKLSRSKHGAFNIDNYVDICGYAAIAGECHREIVELRETQGGTSP